MWPLLHQSSTKAAKYWVLITIYLKDHFTIILGCFLNHLPTYVRTFSVHTFSEQTYPLIWPCVRVYRSLRVIPTLIFVTKEFARNSQSVSIVIKGIQSPTNSHKVMWSIRSAHTVSITKGQLISEWLFDILNFPKNQCKNLMNFCPRISKLVKLYE